MWVPPCSSFSKLFWLFWVPCISIWVVELKVTVRSHRLWQGRGPEALLTGPYSQSYGFPNSHVQMWELDHKEGCVCVHMLSHVRLFAAPQTIAHQAPLIMEFPRQECWSVLPNKALHWRIDAFELQCWRTPLRVLWTAGKSNQSILKEINPEYSLEGLLLKLQ